MNPKLKLVASLIGAFLVGCMTIKVATIRLNAEEFLEHYCNPGTVGDYWEYRGKSSGNHWIYHYKMERQSVPIVVEKAYIPENLMPAAFPEFPQPNRQAGTLEGVAGVLPR